jgi:serine/threonine protein kinase
VECGLVWHADAIACRCGSPLRRAAVPHQLGDRLKFIQRIGAGATGIVYEARDLVIQQKRAVKALPRIDPAQLRRVRREAQAMAVAAHRHLAVLYGVDIWGDSPLLVVEYCERGTLADRLRRGPMDLGRVIDIGLAMADALKHLHDNGVVHCDIKPSNIGFSSSNEPKLLDFGLANLVASHGSPDGTVPAPPGGQPDPPSTGDRGVVRGTPPYLSPEVLAGAPPARQDDLWSLGVTLLEACTGSTPFRALTSAATLARATLEAGHAARAAERLPAPFNGLFAELLDRRPQFRPQSAGAFRDCLERVKHGVTHG